ncbi:Sensor histidine kinase RcsC [Paenibacillus solanacearum]|uniref:histidine kinase n=1 Tax=Paenibacillus solanacearum TaxID=2048548 RepID=A0A916K2D0_9BACL|nr:ATP-binding protein [Paenibacillus solanacearum]CAG7620207.1 Sensor histidine kinase RcsC [Paenibacillus solanacearum]
MINQPQWLRSLRIRLVMMFAATLVISFFLYILFDFATRDFRKEYYISYETSKQAISGTLEAVEQELPRLHNPEALQSLLSRISKEKQLDLLLADLQGNVVYRSPDVRQSAIDLYQIAYEQKDALAHPEAGKPLSLMAPVQFQGNKLFLVVSGRLVGEAAYRYKFPYWYNAIVALAIFLLVFYLFTYNKMRQIQEMNAGLERIAQGNLSVRLRVRSRDELGALTGNINAMVGQLEEKIAQERLAEQTKNELITNISHDLRTPLTSIIGYLSVLSGHKETREALQPYIQSALNKSNQLKQLIDDLFEYTRLTSNQVSLDRSRIDLTGLINQLIMEFMPLAEQQQVQVHSAIPEHRIVAHLDAGKMVRAIDNLLTNALKFSVKPGTIDITLRQEASSATLSITNTGNPITDEQEKRLFERFYKADESRGGHSMPRGSGLGLSIAQSIVQLHGGDIALKRTDRHYEFCVRIPL